MGFFDFLKAKPDGPKPEDTSEQNASAPASAASSGSSASASSEPSATSSGSSASASSVAGTSSSSVFQVKFGDKILYPEPDRVPINVEFGYSGVAEVSSESGNGGTSEVGYVRSLILTVISDETYKLGKERLVSINDLNAYQNELAGAVKKALKEKGYETHSFVILSLGPTESGRQILSMLEQKRKFEAMTPEEHAKMIEENQRKAQEIFDRMTPEEKEEARRNVERMMEQEAAKQAQIMAQVQAIREGRDPSDPSGSNNVSFAPQGADASPVKFCPSCNSPVGGGKFCTNCGAPLT